MGRQNKLSLDCVSRHSVTSPLWKCTAYVAWHRDVPSSKDTGHPSGQVAKVGNQAAPAAWWFTGLGVFTTGIEICRQIPIFGIDWSIWASKKSPPYVLHPQWIKVRNRWLSSEKWCLRTAWMTPKSPAPDRSLHQHLPVSGSQCISAANKSASPIPGWLMDVHFLNVKWFLTSRLVPLILVKVSR